MSLLLKAECQKTLDDLGYPFLSAIMDGSKHIAIVADCGRPFFYIPNLKISKTTPNAKEISLAATEIKNFFERNSKQLTRLFDLITMIDDRDVSDEADKWNSQYKDQGVIINTNQRYSRQDYNVYARILQNGLYYSWNEDDGFTNISLEKSSLKLTELPAISIYDHPLYSEFNAYIKELQDLGRFLQEKSEIISNFSSCRV